MGAGFGDQQQRFGKHLHCIAALPCVPQVPDLDVQVYPRRGGHRARRSARHLFDQRAAMAAGEGPRAIRPFQLGELGQAAEGVASLVLDEVQVRDIPHHARHEFDAHVADGLHEHGQPARLGDGLVVAGHGIQVELRLAALARRQSDHGIRADRLGVLGVAHRGLGVGGLHADHDLGPQPFGGLHDRLGARDTLLEGQQRIFAGQLRPDDAVNARPIQKANLLGEGLQVHLAIVVVRRGDDRVDAPKVIRTRGQRPQSGRERERCQPLAARQPGLAACPPRARCCPRGRGPTCL